MRWGVIGVLLLACVRPAVAQQVVVGRELRIAEDAQLSGDVGHPSYVSQLNRWLIDSNGNADFRYLFTDELRAKLFTADMEAVLAGSQRVTKSFSLISQPFTCPAASGTSTLWVQDAPTYGDAAVFVSGDAVIIRNLSRTSFGPFSISDCVGVVTSYTDGTGANAGQQSWTFTRNAGGDAGAMTASTVVPVDTLVQDLGVSGNGYVETTAVDGAAGINAPYTQVVTWTTAPVAANLSTRARLGNLRGITGSTEYGLLAGTYAATGGQYFKASDLGFELHGINLQMWDGSTNVIKLDRTVPSFAIGTPIPSGYLTGGDGFWVGKDSGVYKLRIGDPTGNRMTFASGVLTIIGDGGGVTNINGGNLQTDSVTAVQIAANAITTSELNADSVTSAKIAAGTIVASDIQAGSITADRLNVSTLSAITADIGSVTAGSITGVNVSVASGNVVLNSSGLTLTSGSGTSNKVKWSSGATIYGDGTNDLVLFGPDEVLLLGSGGGTLRVSDQTLLSGSTFTIDSLAGTGNDYACLNSSGQLFRSDTAC